MRSRSADSDSVAGRAGATWQRKSIAVVVAVALVGGCVWMAYATFMPQRSVVVPIPARGPARPAPVAQAPTQAPPKVVDLSALMNDVPAPPPPTPVQVAAPAATPVATAPPAPRPVVHIAPVVIPVDPEPASPAHSVQVPPPAPTPVKAPAPAPSTLKPVEIPE